MEYSTIFIASIFVVLLTLSCPRGVTNAEVAKDSQPTQPPMKSVLQAQTKIASSTSAPSNGEKEKSSPVVSVSNDNCTNSTCEKGKDNGYFTTIVKQISENKDMLLRTMYVLIGVTSIIIIYFVVKAWRLRRRRQKARKYGIITTPASDLEMAPLDQGDDDDDDEDMTVFEMNGKRRK